MKWEKKKEKKRKSSYSNQLCKHTRAHQFEFQYLFTLEHKFMVVLLLSYASNVVIYLN